MKEYLNVGCGKKFHEDWTNVDMVSHSPAVQAHNLIKGFPYAADTFSVVYHSQVIEHIPKQHAEGFVKECFRVLKPGGILRVVCPDMENLAKEYLRTLNLCLENPENTTANADYDWMMLEIFDQAVRTESGGQMAAFLKSKDFSNQDFVVSRLGTAATHVLDQSHHEGLLRTIKRKVKDMGFGQFLKVSLQMAKEKLLSMLVGQNYRLGAFRNGGEVHLWMYDRHSLGRLLKATGFENIRVVSPTDSGIASWAKYELDVKNGQAIDPTSLFMEAQKPILS